MRWQRRILVRFILARGVPSSGHNNGYEWESVFGLFFSLTRKTKERVRRQFWQGPYETVFVGRYGVPKIVWNNWIISNKMTVNDFKETACATVQPIVEDMEVEGEVVIGSYDHEENLLGRVLAGKTVTNIKWEKQSL